MAEPRKPSSRRGSARGEPVGRDSARGEAAGRDGERAMRGLVGAGPSAVGVSGVMRTRDVSRPTVEDLAAAERDLVVVRRNYRPEGSGGRSPERS